jgi:hypothetical protein
MRIKATSKPVGFGRAFWRGTRAQVWAQRQKVEVDNRCPTCGVLIKPSSKACVLHRANKGGGVRKGSVLGGLARGESGKLRDAPLGELKKFELSRLGLHRSDCGNQGTVSCAWCEYVLPVACPGRPGWCGPCKIECRCRRRSQ